MNTLDDILGKRGTAEQQDAAELEALAAEPDTYRAAFIRPRPQMGFVVVEADGTMHGFAYHTLSHPKHQVRNGEEYLTFTADGLAVVMQGQGLRVVFLALVRHTLAEVREYDGKPIADGQTRIIRLAVAETPEEPPTRRPPFELVK